MKFNFKLLKELAIELINGWNINQSNVKELIRDNEHLKANVIRSWINWIEINLMLNQLKLKVLNQIESKEI